MSTSDQHPEAQQAALLEHGCRKVWSDHGTSGGSPLLERPVFRQLLDVAAPGDVVVVTKLDRAFRSLADLLHTTGVLTERGLAIVALDGSINTADDSPHAALTRAVLGAVAEWERALISSRTVEALAHRRAEGVRLGRPPVLTDADVERAKVWRADGWTNARIAHRLGCSERTLRRAINQSVGVGG